MKATCCFPSKLQCM